MTMKTIKVAEATERQLDWLVASIEGDELPKSGGKGLDYSSDWACGGPIIEREGLLVRPQPGTGWDSWKHGADEPCYSTGPTPLIAVMRCYVSSCLGSEVEVPDELN